MDNFVPFALMIWLYCWQQQCTDVEKQVISTNGVVCSPTVAPIKGAIYFQLQHEDLCNSISLINLDMYVYSVPIVQKSNMYRYTYYLPSYLFSSGSKLQAGYHKCQALIVYCSKLLPVLVQQHRMQPLVYSYEQHTRKNVCKEVLCKIACNWLFLIVTVQQLKIQTDSMQGKEQKCRKS